MFDMEKFMNVVKNPIFIVSASLIALVGVYLLAVLTHYLIKNKPQIKTKTVNNPEYAKKEKEILAQEPQIMRALIADKDCLEKLKVFQGKIQTAGLQRTICGPELNKIYIHDLKKDTFDLLISPEKAPVNNNKLFSYEAGDHLNEDTAIIRGPLISQMSFDQWKAKLITRIDSVITRIDSVIIRVVELNAIPKTIEIPYNPFTFENEKGHFFGCFERK